MVWKKKVYSIFSIFLAIFALSFSIAKAADANFGISLDSSYEISEHGETTVLQHFTLTNKNPTIFAKDYSIQVSGVNLQEVRAVDDKNVDIPTTVVVNGSATIISLTFNDKLVGEGKTRSFSISFHDPDAASINGNVLEVSIPQLSTAKDFESYHISLKTPEKFGAPVRVTPKDFGLTQNNGTYILDFANVGQQSISALFGQKQVFAYTLHYVLENPTGSNGVIQIALPPDTAYQKVVYSSLNPEPKEVKRDDDGNWIATYQIEAQKNLGVELRGKVNVTLTNDNQHANIPPTPQLTATQKYWETQDPQVQDLAKKYATPKDIYDFVVNHFTYNYQKVTDDVARLGALGA